jgi:hypothetical protein
MQHDTCLIGGPDIPNYKTVQKLPEKDIQNDEKMRYKRLISKRCVNCNENGLFICSKCKRFYYCGKEDWIRRHKFECSSI